MDLQDIVIKQTQPIRMAQASAGELTHADIGAAFGRLLPQVITHLEAVGAKPGISVGVYDDDGGTVPEGELVLRAARLPGAAGPRSHHGDRRCDLSRQRLP